jgi:hypothetical protein
MNCPNPTENRTIVTKISKIIHGIYTGDTTIYSASYFQGPERIKCTVFLLLDYL